MTYFDKWTPPLSPGVCKEDFKKQIEEVNTHL